MGGVAVLSFGCVANAAYKGSCTESSLCSVCIGSHLILILLALLIQSQIFKSCLNDETKFPPSLPCLCLERASFLSAHVIQACYSFCINSHPCRDELISLAEALPRLQGFHGSSRAAGCVRWLIFSLIASVCVGTATTASPRCTAFPEWPFFGGREAVAIHCHWWGHSPKKMWYFILDLLKKSLQTKCLYVETCKLWKSKLRIALQARGCTRLELGCVAQRGIYSDRAHRVISGWVSCIVLLFKCVCHFRCVAQRGVHSESPQSYIRVSLMKIALPFECMSF